MTTARDRADRKGSTPIQIGNTKLTTDSSNNLNILDNSDAPKKLIASEIEIGDSSNKVIIKKGSDNKVAFQTQASGGSATDSNAGGGVTVVADTTALQALTGNAVGDLVFVSANNKLYLRQTNGWYTVATVANATPVISSAGNASYTFATDGTPIVITVTATDAEGETITYAHTVSSGSLTNGGGATATVVQGTGSNVNQFTITPSTNSAYAGSFSLTFTAQDPNGNTATSSASSFSLSFFSAMKVPSGTTMLFGMSLDGIANGGLDFTGSNTTDLASSSAFDLGSDDWTIEFWYNWDTVSGYQTLLTHGTGASQIKIQSMSGGAGVAWGVYLQGSLLQGGRTGGYQGYETTDAREDVWYHFALVRSGSGSNNIKFYRNGQQQIDGTKTGNIGSTGTAKFSHTSHPAKGRVSNFRVVKGTALYTSNFTPPHEPLTAISGTSLLLFKENSGSTLTDNSSNNVAVTKGSGHNILTNDGFQIVGHRGTYDPPVLKNASNTTLTAPDYFPNDSGYHASMNGHAGYSSPTSNLETQGYRIPELDSNEACKNKTWICWYKGSSSQIVSGGYYSMGVPILCDSINRWFHTGIDDGKIATNSGQGYTRGSTNVCDNQWHMLTWIYSNGTHTRLSNGEMGMWVDGTYETKHTVYAYGSLRILNHLFLSGSGVVQHPERVDSFQLFDGELTDAQISEIYGA